MTTGNNLGHNLEPTQEATRIQVGDIFHRGGKFKNDRDKHRAGHTSEE